LLPNGRPEWVKKGTVTRIMATVDVDDTVWAGFLALCKRKQIQDPELYLHQWLRRIFKHEGMAEGRYWPVTGAIVTRADSQVLIVGNEYARGVPLFWNLPSGTVEPGESLRQAAARELYEESGIQALEVGRLAWIVQDYGGPGSTGILAFVFEVPVWRGSLTLENEERGGLVRRAEFVPYDEACERIFPGSAGPLRDWLASPHDLPHIYWNDSEGPQLTE
jgi:ADP-ribose pyrophosphatase YjhB (NUDIX family)